jgi:hypothetical protein
MILISQKFQRYQKKWLPAGLLPCCSPMDLRFDKSFRMISFFFSIPQAIFKGRGGPLHDSRRRLSHPSVAATQIQKSLHATRKLQRLVDVLTFNKVNKTSCTRTIFELVENTH